MSRCLDNSLDKSVAIFMLFNQNSFDDCAGATPWMLTRPKSEGLFCLLNWKLTLDIRFC